MTDPYRYFRIEAHELTDQLAAALSNLARGAPTATVVGSVLRQAHTLKGAARVVGQAMIADHVHTLEELLEPYRASSERIDLPQLDRMRALVDEISSAVSSLDNAPESGPEPATAGTGPELTPAVVEPATMPTARASLAEIDAVIGGVMRSRTQLSLLRKIADLELPAGETRRLLTGCADRMDRELRQVHDTAEKLRLVPVESIVADLERGARDVAAAQGKRVLVDVVGGRIRLDAPVLASAQAALRQIVRNAVAHGIEAPDERLAAGKASTGRVRLDITQSGSTVVFSCTDDGRGIDLAAVRRELRRAGTASTESLRDDEVLDLLAQGGVSTASIVSEISGRGIGLDVVREAARYLGGRVSIRTVPGVGTTIDLTSPLSLTARDIILVDAGNAGGAGGPLALPLAAIREAVRVLSTDISQGGRGETLTHHGLEVPFLPLSAALGDRTRTSRSSPAWSVLLLDGPGGTAAIGVRRLIRTVSVAIHAIPDLALTSALVSGVWIDVDGTLQLVLDPAAVAAAAQQNHGLSPAVPDPPAPILVVDDSLTTRMLEQSILVAAGYRVELASSAEEGLRLAASRPFSLVLVDVEMPGMDGFAFVEQTRARPELRHLPCILVTSRASEQDRRRGLEAGARAHLDKGEFYQGALLDRISELLAERPVDQPPLAQPRLDQPR